MQGSFYNTAKTFFVKIVKYIEDLNDKQILFSEKEVSTLVHNHGGYGICSKQYFYVAS